MHWVCINKMVKLSAQLPQQRVTRTQRVIGKRTAQVETARRRKEFAELKKEAEQIQQEKFSNLSNLNDYEKQYNTLSSEMKQFFQTPQQMKIEQTARIQSNIPKVQERIKYAQQQNQKNETDFIKEMNEAKQITDSKSRKSEKRSVSNEYKEERKYWKGYLSGLSEGLGKLKGGQDLTYNAVEDFADDKGDFEENQERAENRQEDASKKAFDKLLETSPYRRAIAKHETEFKGKTDWSKDASWRAVAKQSWIEQSGGIVAQQIATGKEGRISEVYKGIVGEKEYKKQSTQIKADYEKAIKEQQDTAIKEWETERGTKPYYLDFTTAPTGDITSQRGTVTDQPQTRFIPIGTGEKQPSKIWTNVKNIYGGIPLKWFLDIDKDPLSVTTKASTLALSPTTFALTSIDVLKDKRKQQIDLSALSVSGQEAITEAQRDLSDKAIGDVKLQEIETFSQKEYQARFEDKYMKQLIKEEITFEEASKQFTESEEAKLVQKKYGLAIEEASQDVSFLKKWGYGGLSTIYGLGGLGLKAIETPQSTALTVGAVYTGTKALQLIPTKLMNLGLGASGVHGTCKAFSPTSTVEEAGGGVVEAVEAVAFLGGSGVKFLKRPKTKYKYIPVKRLISPKNQRAYLTKTKTVIDTGRKTVKDIYKVSKASEQIAWGRRTILTTEGRDLLARSYRMLGVSEKSIHTGLSANIYEGIPYAQKGTTYYLQGLRGTTTYTTQSAYQKAYNLLIKRGGYTSTQARNVLRYYQPKAIYSQYLGDISVTTGDIIKQPIIKIRGSEQTIQLTRIINKELNIITRNKEVINKLIEGRADIMPSIRGEKIYQTKFNIETLGRVGYKQLTQTSALVDKGDDLLRLEKKITSFLTARKDLPLSLTGERTFIDASGKISYAESESALIRGKSPIITKYPTQLEKIPKPALRVIQINQKLMNKIKGLFPDDTIKWVKPVKSPIKSSVKPVKSPIKSSVLNELKLSNLKNQINKIIPDITPTSQRLIPITDKVVTTQLQTALAPPVQVIKNQIKAITKGFSESTLLSSLGLSTALVSSSAQKKKQVLIPAFKLKSDNILKTEIAEISGMKLDTALVPAMKQSSAVTQILKLDNDFVGSPSAITSFPIQPVPKIPTTPTPIIPFPLFEKLKKKRKGKKTKGIYEELYIPDFTARALGLGAVSISEAQAKRQLKKLLTGLEIRRAVKVRRRR